MTQDIAVITLDILDNSDDTSHQDQHAGEIEHFHVFLPWHAELGGLVGWGGMHAFVEEERDEDEDAEGDDLDKETDQDYVLGERRVGAISGGEHAGSYTGDVRRQNFHLRGSHLGSDWRLEGVHASRQNQEGENIRRHENLRQPSLLDQAVLLPIDSDNDAPENHVNACCD